MNSRCGLIKSYDIFTLQEEKKLAKEKEKLEDKKRLEKLCNDMNREDKEFLRSIKSILDEYVKQEKNTLPLIKCIRVRFVYIYYLFSMNLDINVKPQSYFL